MNEDRCCITTTALPRRIVETAKAKGKSIALESLLGIQGETKSSKAF